MPRGDHLLLILAFAITTDASSHGVSPIPQGLLKEPGNTLWIRPHSSGSTLSTATKPTTIQNVHPHFLTTAATDLSTAPRSILLIDEESDIISTRSFIGPESCWGGIIVANSLLHELTSTTSSEICNPRLIWIYNNTQLRSVDIAPLHTDVSPPILNDDGSYHPWFIPDAATSFSSPNTDCYGTNPPYYLQSWATRTRPTRAQVHAHIAAHHWCATPSTVFATPYANGTADPASHTISTTHRMPEESATEHAELDVLAQIAPEPILKKGNLLLQFMPFYISTNPHISESTVCPLLWAALATTLGIGWHEEALPNSSTEIAWPAYYGDTSITTTGYPCPIAIGPPPLSSNFHRIWVSPIHLLPINNSSDQDRQSWIDISNSEGRKRLYNYRHSGTTTTSSSNNTTPGTFRSQKETIDALAHRQTDALKPIFSPQMTSRFIKQGLPGCLILERTSTAFSITPDPTSSTHECIEKAPSHIIAGSDASHQASTLIALLTSTTGQPPLLSASSSPFISQEDTATHTATSTIIYRCNDFTQTSILPHTLYSPVSSAAIWPCAEPSLVAVRFNRGTPLRLPSSPTFYSESSNGPPLLHIPLPTQKDQTTTTHGPFPFTSTATSTTTPTSYSLLTPNSCIHSAASIATSATSSSTIIIPLAQNCSTRSYYTTSSIRLMENTTTVNHPIIYTPGTTTQYATTEQVQNASARLQDERTLAAAAAHLTQEQCTCRSCPDTHHHPLAVHPPPPARPLDNLITVKNGITTCADAVPPCITSQVQPPTIFSHRTCAPLESVQCDQFEERKPPQSAHTLPTCEPLRFCLEHSQYKSSSDLCQSTSPPCPFLTVETQKATLTSDRVCKPITLSEITIAPLVSAGVLYAIALIGPLISFFKK